MNLKKPKYIALTYNNLQITKISWSVWPTGSLRAVMYCRLQQARFSSACTAGPRGKNCTEQLFFVSVSLQFVLMVLQWCFLLGRSNSNLRSLVMMVTAVSTVLCTSLPHNIPALHQNVEKTVQISSMQFSSEPVKVLKAILSLKLQ